MKKLDVCPVRWRLKRNEKEEKKISQQECSVPFPTVNKVCVYFGAQCAAGL